MEHDVATRPITAHSQRVAVLRTRSGRPFLVRATRSGDEDDLARFFQQVSADDLRFRFLDTVKVVGPAAIAEMANSKHGCSQSFLVREVPGGDIVATATLGIDRARARGEVAIVLRPEFKGVGLGWSLLAYTADQARARGLATLESVEDRANSGAIAVERDMSFQATPVEGEPSLVLLRLLLR